MEDSKESMMADLEPLIQEAERKGQWLFFQGAFGPYCFSPSKLRDNLSSKEGLYLWGKATWGLRDPVEFADELLKRIEKSQSMLIEPLQAMKEEAARKISA